MDAPERIDPVLYKAHVALQQELVQNTAMPIYAAVDPNTGALVSRWDPSMAGLSDMTEHFRKWALETAAKKTARR